LLFALNPEEFVEELWFLNAIEIVHQIAELFQQDVPLSWHFLCHVFRNLEFRSQTTESEMVSILKFLCRFAAGEVLGLAKELPHDPIREVPQIFEDVRIVDATLHLCELNHDIERARDFGSCSLEFHHFQGTAVPVCEQIFAFFSEAKCNKSELWQHFMGAFALPLLAALENHEKRTPILELLRRFLRRMVGDVESVGSVAEGFPHSFNFLPFRIARPFIRDIFCAIDEKNEFAGALAHVVRDEAISAQLSRIRKLSSGVVCHATRCGKCGRILGDGAATAACGSVFHEVCAKDLQCEMCGCIFQLRRRPWVLEALPANEEPLRLPLGPKPLAPPGIGERYTLFKTDV
jgi:hypothetical protein